MARLVLAFVVLFVGPSTARAGARPVRADTIYFNGRIETLDDHFHRARALAVAGDRIVAVGGILDVLPHVGLGTRLVDLGGRALLPGFVDAHAHWLNDADLVGLTLDQAQDLALANGITAFADMFVNPAVYDELTSYAAAGSLRMRTSLYLVYDNPCGDVLGDWFLAHPPVRDATAMLRVPGVKIFSDGGSCGVPAVTFAFIGIDPPMGDLWLDQAAMTAAVALADANGYQVAIHAIGDRARDVAQTAIAAVLGGGANVLRHRIEHNSFLRPDQIETYRATGIVPTIWVPSTCAVDAGTSTLSSTPPENLVWAYPWRSLLAAGVRPAWHSDWPYREANVMHHLYGLTTARQVGADGTVCEPPPFLEDEAVSVRSALRMMTLGSAYALGLDRVLGSLEPGKLADLVVLDEDPLDTAPGDIKDLRVLATLVGGALRFCAPGASPLCP